MRCFSSPRSLMKSIHVSGLGLTGCPIRISADQFVCADSRSFSQLITSFFASESLGIHRLPFFYFFILTSQFSYTIIQSLHDTVGFFIFSSFYAFLKIRFKFHSYVQLIYLHTSFDIRNLFSVLSIMSKNSSFRFFLFPPSSSFKRTPLS